MYWSVKQFIRVKTCRQQSHKWFFFTSWKIERLVPFFFRLTLIILYNGSSFDGHLTDIHFKSTEMSLFCKSSSHFFMRNEFTPGVWLKWLNDFMISSFSTVVLKNLKKVCKKTTKSVIKIYKCIYWIDGSIEKVAPKDKKNRLANVFFIAAEN